MARVQAEFAGQERLFVNFPRGVQIDHSDTVSSPFLLLIERREPGRPPETVFVAKHARARSHAPLLQVDAPVIWAKVVHDTYVSNIVNDRQVDPVVVRERFDLDLDMTAPSPAVACAARRSPTPAGWASCGCGTRGSWPKRAEAAAVTTRGRRLWPQDSGEPFAARVKLSTNNLRRRRRPLRTQGEGERPGSLLRPIAGRRRGKGADR
ncbi:hypothetical protein SAMN05421879_12023 [Ornithinimicrobium cerasi]|uniref:Uncharacterized protein n=2 Tax=Ornithinimicrobium cerasi TaxID=2248773 RepID=A0A285VW54_9MICO|nr:hypothetical protein SAMN05421879_11714 [Ornithinimicrobium cerasi]SOC58020.1 hypothetical protein SAMN05421879_12023 [Ornithinimicrobium cerasi]